MDSVLQALSVKRVFNHPRDLVFKAWTEPTRLEKWFSPNPNNRVKAKVDLKAGGSYRIAVIPPEGDGWVVGGTYREIEPPERLAFTWKWEYSEEPSSLVSVDFTEIEGGTEVTVTHTQLESQESFDNHQDGWQRILLRLGDYMTDPMEWLATNPLDLLTAATQIEISKHLAKMGLDRLVRSLEFVPAERREWSPSETSKTPLRIASHVGFSNERFAAVLRGDPMPYRTARETANEIYAIEVSLTQWDDVMEHLAKTSRDVLDAFDHVDPARLVVDAKVAFVLNLVGRHADGHASQIDYLQTVWGDTEDHF